MATRQAEKEARRAEREQRERELAAREQRGRRVRLALAAVLAVAVVAVVAVLAIGATGGSDDAGKSGPGTGGAGAAIPPARDLDLDSAVKAAGGRLQKFEYGTGINDHTNDPVKYPMNPPTNGPHNPVPAQDGNYAGRESPPKENIVHALEHGRVVIQYRPGLPAKQVAQLQTLFEEDPDRVLLLQNDTGMKAPVAVTAWAQMLTFPSFNDKIFDAIRAFTRARRDQGPEKVLSPE